MKKQLLIIPLLAALCLVPLAGCTSSSDDETHAEQGSFVLQMPDFKTVDLEGNEVDNSVFQKSRITVINFWGTFCSPCINEMADVSDWAESLDPEQVQVIGVLTDVQKTSDSTYQDAQDIVNSHGVTYTSILGNEDWTDTIDTLIGVPTTYFVNREGKSIAQPVIGAYVDQYKDTVEKLLNGEDTE